MEKNKRRKPAEITTTKNGVTRTLKFQTKEPEIEASQVETEERRREIDDESEQSFAAFRARFSNSQGCRIKVHRQTPRGRQYCFYGTPEEIESEETLRQFHAKQAFAHEEGVYFISAEVNGETRDVTTVHIAPQAREAEIVTGSASSGGMADYVKLLHEQNSRLEALLMTSGRDRAPMTEMIECIQRLDQMRGTSGNNSDTLLKAIELGQKLSGGGAPQEGWDGLLRDLVKENGPLILGLLRGITARPPQPPAPAQLPQAAAQPPQQAKQTIGEDMPPEQQELFMLKQAIQYLKNKADKQSDPGLYIDLMVDNREEPLYARLISKIVEKDFSAFVEIDPDVAREPYRTFFKFIHDGIRRVFVPADTVATDTGRSGGNEGDPSRNGTAGKTSGK